MFSSAACTGLEGVVASFRTTPGSCESTTCRPEASSNKATLALDTCLCWNWSRSSPTASGPSEADNCDALGSRRSSVPMLLFEARSLDGLGATGVGATFCTATPLPATGRWLRGGAVAQGATSLLGVARAPACGESPRAELEAPRKIAVGRGTTPGSSSCAAAEAVSKDGDPSVDANGEELPEFTLGRRLSDPAADFWGSSLRPPLSGAIALVAPRRSPRLPHSVAMYASLPPLSGATGPWPQALLTGTQEAAGATATNAAAHARGISAELCGDA
mmetsp:Transcript_123155/g.348021  ORF Transcript_123155/g.348021 Transcript_123155/m.348021 type:complete len:275 (+) Transcript_123155:703-1527(+)